MNDIDALQKTWQDNLQPLLSGREAVDKQYEANTAKLNAQQDKVNKAHGLKRLKNPFIKAAKIRPLKRKQRKFEKRISEKDQQIANVLDGLFTNYDKILIRDNNVKTTYNYLKDTYDQVEKTKAIVQHAAKKCGRAATVENVTGDATDGNGRNRDSIIIGVVVGIAAHFNTKSALKSVKKAQQSVETLRQNLKDDGSQISSVYAAEYISRDSSWAIIDDAIGGWMSGWGNWMVARELKRTKEDLLNVTSTLDRFADSLTDDKLALLASTSKQSSDMHPTLVGLVKSLEPYLPAAKPTTGTTTASAVRKPGNNVQPK